MITYSVNRVRYTPKTWKFPAGEVGVQTLFNSSPDSVALVTINASLTSSDEVMQLFMLTDAIRRQYKNASLELVLGYTPYGRQDRVCNPGDSLSIRVFANLINSQGYAKVTVIDPHSYVTEALIDNCQVTTQKAIFDSYFANRVCSVLQHDLVLAAPDAGAAKKAGEIFDGGYGFDSLIYANKTRDMATGHIVEYSFTGDVSGKSVVVVDDLVDGGATFLLLGKKLKEAGANEIMLCVTHGIFTQGVGKLREMYDKILTTNTYHQDRSGEIDGVYYSVVM